MAQCHEAMLQLAPPSLLMVIDSGSSPARRWLDARMTLSVMPLKSIEAVESPFLLADITGECRRGEVVERLPVAPQVTTTMISTPNIVQDKKRARHLTLP